MCQICKNSWSPSRSFQNIWGNYGKLQYDNIVTNLQKKTEQGDSCKITITNLYKLLWNLDKFGRLLLEFDCAKEHPTAAHSIFLATGPSQQTFFFVAVPVPTGKSLQARSSWLVTPNRVISIMFKNYPKNTWHIIYAIYFDPVVINV